MKIKTILGIVIACCGVAFVCPVKANLYRVENVAVSAESTSALAAKDAALASGQLTAFNRLVARLAPQSFSSLPQLSAEEVLPYVVGVSIENEKTTATKYMGSIAVEFNPSAVKKFLQTENVTYLKAQPPTLLVIPEYVKDGVVLTLESESPLYAALKNKGSFAPFYQAVVPAGTEDEIALTHQGVAFAADLLPRYQKERLMILRLEHEGDDFWQISSSFYPEKNMQHQKVVKRFKFSSGDSSLAAAQMADAVFKSMEASWRTDTMSSLADDQTLYLRIRVNSLSDWLVVENEMKAWSFFEQYTLKGLFLPQILVEATYKGDLETIQQKLQERGWLFNRDASGTSGTLTRIQEYEQE